MTSKYVPLEILAEALGVKTPDYGEPLDGEAVKKFRKEFSAAMREFGEDIRRVKRQNQLIMNALERAGISLETVKTL